MSCQWGPCLSNDSSDLIAMDKLWGNEGSPINWCRLHDLASKKVVNMVCDIACNQHDSGATLVLVLPSNFFARIEGLPVLDEGVQQITLTDLQYDGMKRLHTFSVTENTVVKTHSRVEHRDFFNLTELCCGMGFATQGFQQIGMKTVLACDVNERFTEAFRHFHPEASIVLGDVNNQSTIRQLVASSGRPSVAFVGFSCQPFSKGGEQLGADDCRSSSLAGSLEICHLLRCPAVILECVPEAANNKHVRHVLQKFCCQCNYHLNETQLQQEHIWPCRRDRWWVILTASSLGSFQVRPFPMSTYPKSVKQILPHCWNMAAGDMEELKLTPSEHERFLRFRPDLSTMLLTARGICPTFLRSCGSQVLPCVCQCRLHSFTDRTLESRGIFGILMPASGITMIHDQAVVAMRHPHPCEGAILSGCLLPESWPPNLRLSLAGLGQQANPCQALWIGSQLLAHVDLVVGGSTKMSACQELDKFLTLLLNQSKTCFASMPKPVPTAFDVMPDIIEHSANQAGCQVVDEHEAWVEPPVVEHNVAFARSDWIHQGGLNSCTILTAPHFQPFVIQLSSPEATVGNLVAAEIGMLPSLNYVEVVEPASGVPLDHSSKLQGQCVLLCSSFVDSSSEVEPVVETDGYLTPPQVLEDISPTAYFAVEEHENDDENDGDVLPLAKKLRLDVGETDETAGAMQKTSTESTCASDPLARLTSQQLLDLAPPVVSTFQVFLSMLKPGMSCADRLAILDTQKTAWADDEIRWHIEQVLDKAKRPGTVILDPLISAECVLGRGEKLLLDWLQSLPDKPKVILSAVCLNGHWTPFAWTFASDCLQANSWDVPSTSNAKLFNLLHDKLSKALLCRTYLTRCLHRSVGIAEGCGICAIRFLDYFMRAKMLPTTDHEVETLHFAGKQMFRAFLEAQRFVTRPWAWGFGLDPQVADKLLKLLEQHGVPKEKCEQRAFLVQQALGVQDLQKALVSTSPWRNLKAISNQVRPPLQLVLHDELQASLREKASSKPDGKRKKKGNDKEPVVAAKPAPLDPAKLKFDEGAFVSECGAPLQQIVANQLGPLVEGVAIATIGSVEQFLRAGNPVTKAHLAVFVINADESAMTTRLPWSLCRVALRCVANNEPMLIQGFLVQLGSQIVQQGKARHEVDIEDVGAACVKISIYRDSVVGQWDEIVAGPVKYLFKILDMLVPCDGHDDGAPCNRWHPPKDSNVRDPVFDVWRRQWLSLSMQTCAPTQASIFMVNVRYAKSIESCLLAQSGDSGIFLEPRSLDSKSAVLDYQIIWLPRKSMPEVLHIRQTNPCVVGLARMGSRLGVRVKVEDANTIGQLLRPDSIMLASGPRLEFELGPLPYGLDRSGVAALCKKWGWTVKPVNPSRSLVGDLGTVWLVQTCSEPPSAVFSLKGQDVVVTKLPSKPSAQSASSQPTVASPATLSLCTFDGGEGATKVDPWLQTDPWGYDAAKTKMGKSAPPDLTLNLQQIEDRAFNNRF